MAPPPLESPTAPASQASPPSSANRRTKEPRGSTQQPSRSSAQQGLHACTPSLRSRCCAWRSCVRGGQGDVSPQDDEDEQPQVLDSGRRFTEGGVEAMLRVRVGAEVPRRTADRGRPSSEPSVWIGRAAPTPHAGEQVEVERPLQPLCPIHSRRPLLHPLLPGRCLSPRSRLLCLGEHERAQEGSITGDAERARGSRGCICSGGHGCSREGERQVHLTRQQGCRHVALLQPWLPRLGGERCAAMALITRARRWAPRSRPLSRRGR